jgi:hypothetical protein
MFSREGWEDPGLPVNKTGPCVVGGGGRGRGGRIRLVAAPGGGDEDRGQSAHRVVVEKKGAMWTLRMVFRALQMGLT